MNDRARYDLIDPLRAFAAIAVVAFHAIDIFKWDSLPHNSIFIWFHCGWMGVDIFFVISGFVITLSALNIMSRHNGNCQLTFMDFMERRIRRILPLHYLALGLFILISYEICLEPGFIDNLIAHILMIHNLFPDFHRAINAPNWTLALECQFYLLLILVVRYINYNNIKYFVLAAFVMTFCWRALFFHIVNSGSPFFTDVFMWVTQLPGVVDAFASGMLVAFLSKTKYFQHNRSRAWLRLALFSAFVFCMALSFYILNRSVGIYWQSIWHVTFTRSALAITFGLLVAFLSAFTLSQRVRRWLSPIIYLGVISYGIYLFHWPILLFINKFNLKPEIKFGLTLGIAILLASLSWHFYEARFLNKKP